MNSIMILNMFTIRKVRDLVNVYSWLPMDGNDIDSCDNLFVYGY